MLSSFLASALVLAATADGTPPLPSDAPTLPPAAVTQLQPAPAAAPDRAARITIELLVAGAAGVGAGAVGGYFGCLASQSPNGQTCSTATVAAVGLTGYGLTVAAIVPMVGDALGGDGLLWASWAGEAAGLGVGLALAQGNPRNAMLFCSPLMLVGAIVGYELTSNWGPSAKTSTTVVQSVALQPVNSGATLAVGGRF